ncbi:hypothetical protein AX17_001874 [Amanita inopinata Kibby_2008]|nr:hypothetical protein AX17_001874 [Amanita inopinata Kibby_2008]
MSHPTAAVSPRVVVIGAGCGGIAFSIALKRQLGYENFVLYERSSGIGGTWRENTYPGCSSDVAVHFFSLSTDLRNWSATHAYQDEILAYWQHLAEKYDLFPNIIFNHKVVAAEWDDAKQAYDVTVEDAVSGRRFVTRADILVSAIGILDVPRLPDIPNISAFRGEMFHSSRWDDQVELQGKRVAVIGNGASAVQFVPRISQDPTVIVTNFCRTPSWILPPMRHNYSSLRLWLTRNVPGLMRLVRFSYFIQSELLYWLVFSNSLTRRLLQYLCKLYMLYRAPDKYHEKMIPKHQLGCKRLLLDTSYLESLHRPNVSICWDGITEIVEDGITTGKGDKMEFDVVIAATGFVADGYAIPVKGRNSVTVDEYYRSSGGPKAYLGTSIPGFPNFYTLLGPNTATGHTSVIFSHEVQIDYILQLIRPLLDKKVSSFEVKAQPTDAYNAKIHQRLASSVFMQCLSWYRTGGGGKVTNIFPGSATLFWWWLRKPIWDDYIVVNGQAWETERTIRKRRRVQIIAAAITALLGVGLSYKFERQANAALGLFS